MLLISCFIELPFDRVSQLNFIIHSTYQQKTDFSDCVPEKTLNLLFQSFWVIQKKVKKNIVYLECQERDRTIQR